MTLSPHDLINLPGAGNAEKALREAGLWRDVMTDTERINWLAENVSLMKRDTRKQSWFFETSAEYYDPDFFREDIDNASAIGIFHENRDYD